MGKDWGLCRASILLGLGSSREPTCLPPATPDDLLDDVIDQIRRKYAPAEVNGIFQAAPSGGVCRLRAFRLPVGLKEQFHRMVGPTGSAPVPRFGHRGGRRTKSFPPSQTGSLRERPSGEPPAPLAPEPRRVHLPIPLLGPDPLGSDALWHPRATNRPNGLRRRRRTSGSSPPESGRGRFHERGLSLEPPRRGLLEIRQVRRGSLVDDSAISQINVERDLLARLRRRFHLRSAREPSVMA